MFLHLDIFSKMSNQDKKQHATTASVATAGLLNTYANVIYAGMRAQGS